MFSEGTRQWNTPSWHAGVAAADTATSRRGRLLKTTKHAIRYVHDARRTTCGVFRTMFSPQERWSAGRYVFVSRWICSSSTTVPLVLRDTGGDSHYSLFHMSTHIFESTRLTSDMLIFLLPDFACLQAKGAVRHQRALSPRQRLPPVPAVPGAPPYQIAGPQRARELRGPLSR